MRNSGAITIDDMIEYRANRLAVFEQRKGFSPHAEQRARREKRLLDSLIRLRSIGEGKTDRSKP